MTAIIISSLALAVAIVALILAIKKQNVIKETTREKEIKIEYAPIEHPFTYDSQKKVYQLDGSLKVNGGVSCLEKGKEE